MIFLPFLISTAIGFLILEFMFKDEIKFTILLKVFLGSGLGLGLSSYLTFFSFLIFDRLEAKIIIIAHIIILFALAILRTGGAKGVFSNRPQPKRGRVEVPQRQRESRTAGDPSLILRKYAIPIVVSTLLIFIAVLVIQQGRFYPYGGWDAWQVWNFKAKFLLLSGDNWKDLFSPQLWRSSPHYPLLLPLINVWAWLFTKSYNDATPLLTSLTFTFLTAGILSSTLWERSKNIFALLPGFLILTLPFYVLLATTQYCDIVLSFYLIATITTLNQAQTKQKSTLAFLSGVFAGFLGFTKPEGLIAAFIICLLVFSLTIWHRLKNKENYSLSLAGFFILGLAITSFPTFAFHFLYSPGNQTFINGLTSTLKPATWERLQIIFAFLSQELINKKWNGLWILLLLGLLVGGKKSWTKGNILTAMFLLIYFGIILVYYQINTYFEIKWWLSVSLNRILFSLLPVALLWVFGSILTKTKKD